MTISDGMRIHSESGVPRYRVPDLLTPTEFQMYMASTYNVGIEFVDVSDDMRERITGVGTLPAPTVVSPRDAELVLLREKLGIDNEETLKELHSRVLTRAEFEDKYGPQPAVETPDEKEARLNPEEEEDKEEESQEEEKVTVPDDEVRKSPSDELDDLLDRDNKEERK